MLKKRVEGQEPVGSGLVIDTFLKKSCRFQKKKIKIKNLVQPNFCAPKPQALATNSQLEKGTQLAVTFIP